MNNTSEAECEQAKTVSLLESALKYGRMGWSIVSAIPGEKRPNKKWTQYQKYRPSETEIRAMFSRKNLTGLGVILGSVSGNLYARDFDAPESYHRWKAEYGHLNLPVTKTARGFQVFCRSEGLVRTKKYDDGELRGEGAFSMLPPSRHPDGPEYSWEVEISKTLKIINPLDIGLNKSWSCTQCTHTQETQFTQQTQNTQDTQNTQENTSGLPPSPSAQAAVKIRTSNEAIRVSLPKDAHQNHHCLFILARALLALTQHLISIGTFQKGSTISDESVRKIFVKWYELAKPFLRRDKSRDDYLFEFLDAWENVEHPLGTSSIDILFEKAKSIMPPEEADIFESADIRLLVTFCREMQRNAGDEEFFLSCRTVAQLFKHKCHTTAAAWLKGLVRSKILQETTKGGLLKVEKDGPKKYMATCYRYLHPWRTESDF